MNPSRNEKIAALIIIACLTTVCLFGTGVLPMELLTGEEPAPDLNPNPNIPNPNNATWLGGTFNLIVQGRNTYDSSATLTVGTDFTGDFYAFRNGQWIFLASGSSAGQVESDASDNGFIYLLVKEISSKYFYTDTPTTISRSSHILEKLWTNVDGGQDNEFVYKISLWNIPAAASGYPSRTFYPYFKAESGQGTAANILTINSPADITSIGTSTTTVYIDWETAVSAEKRTAGVYKVIITINSTDTTKFLLEYVNVPGIGYLEGSRFIENVRSSDTQYTFTLGANTFDNIAYWSVPSGTKNEFDNSVALRCSFGASENYTITQQIFQWGYNREGVSDSDSVVLSA